MMSDAISDKRPFQIPRPAGQIAGALFDVLLYALGIAVMISIMAFILQEKPDRFAEYGITPEMYDTDFMRDSGIKPRKSNASGLFAGRVVASGAILFLLGAILRTAWLRLGTVTLEKSGSDLRIQRRLLCVSIAHRVPKCRFGCIARRQRIVRMHGFQIRTVDYDQIWITGKDRSRWCIQSVAADKDELFNPTLLWLRAQGLMLADIRPRGPMNVSSLLWLGRWLQRRRQHRRAQGRSVNRGHAVRSGRDRDDRKSLRR